MTAIAYWALGIPVTCFMVFYHSYGILGIWAGTALAVIVITVAYMV